MGVIAPTPVITIRDIFSPQLFFSLGEIHV
jgi:hypothetical protein